MEIDSSIQFVSQYLFYTNDVVLPRKKKQQTHIQSHISQPNFMSFNLPFHLYGFHIVEVDDLSRAHLKCVLYFSTKLHLQFYLCPLLLLPFASDATLKQKRESKIKKRKRQEKIYHFMHTQKKREYFFFRKCFDFCARTDYGKTFFRDFSFKHILYVISPTFTPMRFSRSLVYFLTTIKNH